jgi:uncharacterized protein
VTCTPLDKQALEDILAGATFLGSGGGGPRIVGQMIIDSLVKAGTLPSLVSLDDLGDGAYGAMSAFAGSPDDASSDTFDWSPATKAFQLLAETMSSAGKPPMSYVMPVELGGGNSFIPLAVAASLSPPIPVADAAGARRAVPSLAETTFAEHSVAISPMVLASPTDEMSVTVSNATVADNVLRAVVGGQQGFGNEAGVAAWAMDGATARASSIAGATTYAQGLGAAIRNAPGDGKVGAALGYTFGFLLCRGTIAQVIAETSGGFDHTTVEIKADDGSVVRVFSQNENLIAYSSARPAPLCLAPDLICYITEAGVCFSNADPELAPGTKMALIGVPAPAAMRTKYFVTQFQQDLTGLGYGGPWVPVETLVG